MSSYSYTESTTFTVTHARHMAAKIATDLKRMQRLYGQPYDWQITQFEEEAVAIMKAGYLADVTYGFKRNGQWIEPTLKYTARDLAGASAGDDDPGRVLPGKDISGATFFRVPLLGGTPPTSVGYWLQPWTRPVACTLGENGSRRRREASVFSEGTGYGVSFWLSHDISSPLSSRLGAEVPV